MTTHAAFADSAPRLKVAPAVPVKATLFPLMDVKLLDSPFKNAMETDRKYLLKLDPDRLMAHMRENAGLKAKAKGYGGWDAGGSGIVGHYLSAVSQMAAATGDPELRRRVDYIIADMAECQQAKDGGLYAFSWDGNVWFPNLAKGEVIPVNTDAWYAMHKTLAGVRDAYLYCGSAQARDLLIKLCDWSIRVTSKLTDAQWQEMMGKPDMMGEFGGPHEVFADAYAITGNRDYLTLAEKFRHAVVFDPMLKGSATALDGKHANTEIPKFVGYERIYELTGAPDWHTASLNFWNDVTGHRSWANGGNSQWEHFFNDADTDKKLTAACGPETCNSYNMLKLTRQLYTLDPSVNYVDFYERVLYNSILPSQSPEGGFVYYTSMRPGQYRVFSRPFDAFWCCVGTGMENHGKYGEMIYAEHGDRLMVNLFIPSVLTWKEKGITLRQETQFPNRPQTRLTVTLAEPKTMTLSLRRPQWAGGGKFTIKVNGKTVGITAKPGSYEDIARAWKSGDTVDVTLPMRVTPSVQAHSAGYTSFYYGPVLLAAALGDKGLAHSDFFGGGDNTNMANQLAAKTIPLAGVPALATTPMVAAARIRRADSGALLFSAAGAVQPAGIMLEPLYKLPFQRYSLYFPSQAMRDKLEAEVADLAARTIDDVVIGDAASEAAHGLQSDRSNTGGAQEPFPHWRDATGFFSYNLAVLPDKPMALRCAYWGGDKNREFDILVNGKVIASPSLTAKDPNGYVYETYPIPEELTAGKTTVIVRFEPKPGNTAGGVFDCRTMRIR